MIYRSRYLDRLSFSPLGYRQERRPRSARALLRPESHDMRAEAETEMIAPTPPTPPQPYVQNQQMGQQSGHLGGHLGERAAYFSSRELRDMLSRCEQAIVSGQAQIEDYEAFVICQQELGSRA